MKQITILTLMIVALLSCKKKEDVTPTPPPVVNTYTHLDLSGTYITSNKDTLIVTRTTKTNNVYSYSLKGKILGNPSNTYVGHETFNFYQNEYTTKEIVIDSPDIYYKDASWCCRTITRVKLYSTSVNNIPAFELSYTSTYQNWYKKYNYYYIKK